MPSIFNQTNLKRTPVLVLLEHKVNKHVVLDKQVSNRYMLFFSESEPYQNAFYRVVLWTVWDSAYLQIFGILGAKSRRFSNQNRNWLLAASFPEMPTTQGPILRNNHVWCPTFLGKCQSLRTCACINPGSRVCAFLLLNW